MTRGLSYREPASRMDYYWHSRTNAWSNKKLHRIFLIVIFQCFFLRLSQLSWEPGLSLLKDDSAKLRLTTVAAAPTIWIPLDSVNCAKIFVLTLKLSRHKPDGGVRQLQACYRLKGPIFYGMCGDPGIPRGKHSVDRMNGQ